MPAPAALGRIATPDEAWLARLPPEPVIDPALPIVDAHHHLWRKPVHPYGVAEFRAELAEAGHDVVATVHIECGAHWHADGPAALRPVGETAHIASLGDPRIGAGIVAHADLTLGDRVRPVLDAHLAAGGGRLRGIRQQATWDEDPVIGHGAPCAGLLGRADFRAGLRHLAPLGLAFDLWVFHHQLDEALQLVRDFPDTLFVLGHCGGPLGYGRHAGRAEEVMTTWRASMWALARCPNVVVKLGGLTMRLGAFPYGGAEPPPSSEELARLWRPVIHDCIAMFGAGRCMFESNFPVEKMGVAYRTLWNAFKRLAEAASAEERRALFAGTARRAYRL